MCCYCSSWSWEAGPGDIISSSLTSLPLTSAAQGSAVLIQPATDKRVTIKHLPSQSRKGSFEAKLAF